MAFPTANEPFELNLVAKKEGKEGGTMLEFVARGPSHMTVVVEGELQRWSFTKDELPYASSKSCQEAMQGRDRACRFVFYSTGVVGTGEWKFFLETPVGSGDGEKDGAVGLKIAFYGHYGLDKMAEGETLTSVRRQLPSWVTMVSWISHWHQYEF